MLALILQWRHGLSASIFGGITALSSKVYGAAVFFVDAADNISAFCRVFRIGQNSETFVTRFVVKDSVDEKLQEMQKVKAQKIGAVMDDPKMLGKLTLDELLRLFGPVIQEDQNPIIVV